jgi:hypothetical protein
MGLCLAIVIATPAAAQDDTTTSALPDTTTTTMPPTTTTTAPPDTTTTAPSGTTTTTTEPGGAPKIDPVPLAGVETMAKVNGADGVMVHTYRDLPLPGCPDVISSAQGDSCFYADPGNGTTWVQLLVLSRNDLSLVSDKDLSCPQATSTPQEYAFDSGGACTTALSSAIDQLNNGDLVIAVNQPGTQADKSLQPPVGVGATLGGVGLNHGIGGPATWYNLPNNGVRNLPDAVRGTVSVVGVPTWKTGGVSLESAHPEQWGSGALTADLVVNNSGFYDPVLPDSVQGASASPVNKVLLQSATSWPSATTGQQAALSALGLEVGLGSNPRPQYYSSPRTDAQWGQVQRSVDQQHYQDLSPTPTAFSATDFDWAKKELNEEISYVIDVNSYMNTLAAPYKGASQALWATFGQVVSAVNDSTSNGKTAAAIGFVLEVIKAALSAAKAIEAAKKAMTVVAAAYSLALAMAKTGSDSSDKPFVSQAADLGRQLQTRLDDAETMMLTRWRNVLVSDYGKMKRVALCSTSAKACDDDNEGWSISVDDEAHMETVLKLGLESELYSTLVPAKYPQAMTVQQITPKSYKGMGEWCTPGAPFTDNTGAYLSSFNTQEGFIQPILLLNPIPGIGKWAAASTSVFSRMFNPVDKGGDYDNGGLGIDESAFFDSNYHVKQGYHGDEFVSKNHYASLTFCTW